jgi:cysteine sulfinate desulfinase/cysteine desulfurase-like protein
VLMMMVQFYGPRIGAVYVRRSGPTPHPPLVAWLHGGGQEHGLRSGTENTGMIVGLGRAAELVRDHVREYGAHMHAVRSALLEELGRLLGAGELHVHGGEAAGGTLPNTASVAFLPLARAGATAAEMLGKCAGVLAGTGAACHSASATAARGTLAALGVEPALARATVRLSVGRETTEDEVRRAAASLAAAVSAAVATRTAARVGE